MMLSISSSLRLSKDWLLWEFRLLLLWWYFCLYVCLLSCSKAGKKLQFLGCIFIIRNLQLNLRSTLVRVEAATSPWFICLYPFLSAELLEAANGVEVVGVDLQDLGFLLQWCVVIRNCFDCRVLWCYNTIAFVRFPANSLSLFSLCCVVTCIRKWDIDDSPVVCFCYVHVRVSPVLFKGGEEAAIFGLHFHCAK